MDFRPTSLKPLLPVFMATTMVLSAGAQQSAQPIIFSSAQSGDTAPVAPSLVPQATEQPNLADKFQAPPANFDFTPPDDTEPLPQMPADSSAENQRLQKVLAERRNWTLMTPEEIFGVTTPEKILGIPERDTAGQEIKQTQVERYLARQDQSQAAATNGWQNGSTAGYWNSSGNQEGDSFNPDGTRRENPRRFLDGFLNSAPDNNGTADGQNEESDWPKPFSAASLPKPDLEQQAAMERFRQLLEPSAPDATAQSSPGEKLFPAPATTLNSILDQPAVNPIGTSFTPLSSDIGKPQGVEPLPGITGQNNPQPVAVPSWEPQPAPWLSQEPQLFAVPQRKF